MPEGHKLQNRWYVGYLVCFLCFALMVWSFYPGMMSPDSIANLNDGRNGTLNDINAPLMGVVWAWLDSIISGPGLMFLLQNAVFWGAAAVLWKAVYRKSFWLGLALVLFALMPHILAQTPVIWKDVGLGASLFMTVALLVNAKKNGSKIALIVSPVFLFYALAARLNAFPAVLPIAIWTAFVAFRVFEIKGRKLLAGVTGAGYFVVLFLAVILVNERITGGETVYPFQQVYLYDLAALSIDKGESIFPEYVTAGENFSIEVVRERFNTRSVSDLIYPDIPRPGDKPVLRLTDNPNEIAELKSKWWSAVKEDPGGYVSHRARVFAQLVGLQRSVTAPHWEPGFASSPPEHRAEGNAGTWVLTKYFSAFRRPFSQTFGFRAGVWLALCGFFLYLAIRRKLKDDWELVFVLSLSSLLFAFAYFPTTPSTEFRYLFWPAIASAIAIIFGIYMLRTEKHDQDLTV